MSEEEDDTVRLENELRDVWLVKVPPRVARLWEKSKEDAGLGKLRIHHGEDDKPRITFHMATDGQDMSKIATATDFNLQFSDSKSNNMRIFSKGDGGVEMQGVVEYSFFMQPLQSQEYENIVQKRTKVANTKARETKEMDAHDAIRLQNKTRIVKMKDRDEESKRRKFADDSEQEAFLREKIFELFARKDEDGNRLSHWQLKDLKREIGIGDSMVRNLLKTLCVYHRDGEFARCYELRPEFKPK
uniref:Transcription initiation factor IIF subunit beta n=1 Tax=Mucochytrium quahogii TaxID=96639 RepID=A0A7S2W5A8_9STRA|mmetsp:Transcript_16086/g.26267  ORF Transcript_16086/g.26267 Transcript_16086/m.26267 type:complete len:244 (+) Transcript_16086:72-803(+)|eukprot:CAMPEP_0203744784 /NCGR_PEP_ID=MMETSP0098-20131031/744_1 /ASSEMBLY_ACC=CAM_ASM_000208 /TAXON_ID=96639 /ORGANISM=" , Strain NY0313808BC1" /LENGTH=243 /DNA_ID=CAMNT_0050632403 /DNA_START=132 /DNA_END=863 /DNA_ORIENTATION=-